MNEARCIEKLRPDHPIEGFDCGREELNTYLQCFAWQNQQAGAAQTYIGLVDDTADDMCSFLSFPLHCG